MSRHVWVLTELAKPDRPISAFTDLDSAKRHAERGRKLAIANGDVLWFRFSPDLMELAHRNNWEGIEANIRRVPLRGEPS